MRVLYVYCHPLPESFHAAVRKEALAGLEAAGMRSTSSIFTPKRSIPC